MKKVSFILLIALAVFYDAFAQTPIVIPSGQQLYFNFSHSTSIGGMASIVPPTTSTTNPWTGHATPGGDVIIPDTIVYNGNKYVVTVIAENAFFGCSSITSVIIPNTVQTVVKSAFKNCTSLEQITIGRGVKYFGNTGAVFSNCPNLETIYYYADSCIAGYFFGTLAVGQNSTLIIGDNVRYIPPTIFQGIGDNNQNILPVSLESVIVGSSVATIGERAFENNSNLTSITFRSQNPPMLGANVFGGITTTEVTCSIPCGRTSAYFNQWGLLFDYIESSGGYSLEITSNNNSWGTAEIIQQPSCSGNAIICATASCGYYFVRWSDGNSNNPRTLTLHNDTQLYAIFASSYNVPDTVFIHDTTIVNHYLHDTTYLPIYLHDTIQMIEYLHDTTYLPIYLHDTIQMIEYLHDTIYLPQYIHDTNYVNVYVHDTTTVTDTITLTEYIPIHDTTYINIHDTTYINVLYPVHDTTYITVTDTVTTTVIVHDTITNTIFDTITNTIYDTTVVNITDTLWMHDTVYLHDTIYIYDTIFVGVDEVESINAKIYTSHGQIVVEGTQGNTVWLYNINGQVLSTKQDDNSPLHFDIPASGTYLIKIGDHPARKVVMIR